MTPSPTPDLRRQRDRFLLFAFAAADLYLEVTTEGRILAGMGASQECFGQSEEALAGRQVEELFAATDRVLLRRLLDRTATGRRFGPYELQSSAERPLSLSGYSFPQAPERVYLAMSRAPAQAPTLTEEAGGAAGAFAVQAEDVLQRATKAGRALTLTLLRLARKDGEHGDSDTSSNGEIGRRFAAFLRSEAGEEGAAVALPGESFAVLHGPGTSPQALSSDLVALAHATGSPGADVSRESLTLPNDGAEPCDTARAVSFAVRSLAEDPAGARTLAEIAQGCKARMAEAKRGIVEVRRILAEERLGFAYQRIVEMDEREVKRFEMLSRIEDGGSPYEFMTFAERSGMISVVDMYACRAALSLIMSEEALSGLSLSVNLSGASLQNDIFVDSLFRMLGRASACSRRLVFEITESARIEKLERVGKIIERLRRFGFQVGLDDFGAGYNSFATLNSLDVDFIKIDGAYVTKVLRSKRDRAMVRLARDLDIATVAEMIESEQQANCFSALSVEYGQGYFFGRPDSLPHPATAQPESRAGERV